jgi:hypothetical protein
MSLLGVSEIIVYEDVGQLTNHLFRYVLLQYMAGKQWLHKAVPSHAWSVLLFQYSRSGVTRPIEIRRGQFLNNQEWYILWTEEDSEGEDEDEGEGEGEDEDEDEDEDEVGEEDGGTNH